MTFHIVEVQGQKIPPRNCPQNSLSPLYAPFKGHSSSHSRLCSHRLDSTFKLSQVWRSSNCRSGPYPLYHHSQNFMEPTRLFEFQNNVVVISQRVATTRSFELLRNDQTQRAAITDRLINRIPLLEAATKYGGKQLVPLRLALDGRSTHKAPRNPKQQR